MRVEKGKRLKFVIIFLLQSNVYTCKSFDKTGRFNWDACRHYLDLISLINSTPVNET